VLGTSLLLTDTVWQEATRQALTMRARNTTISCN